MSAQRRSKSNVPVAGKTHNAAAPAGADAAFLPPLQPQRKLTVILGVVLLLWLGALVVLRLTTVRPVPGRAIETDRTATR